MSTTQTILLPEPIVAALAENRQREQQTRMLIQGFLLGTKDADPSAIYDVSPDGLSLIKRIEHGDNDGNAGDDPGASPLSAQKGR